MQHAYANLLKMFLLASVACQMWNLIPEQKSEIIMMTHKYQVNNIHLYSARMKF